jgi:hypothetical protein
MTSNAYMWDVRRSPQYRLIPPAGRTVEQVLADFDRRLILHQPVDYAVLVARDVLHGFQPFRTVGPKDVSPTPWLLRQKLPSNGRSYRPDELYRSFAGYGPCSTAPWPAGWPATSMSATPRGRCLPPAPWPRWRPRPAWDGPAGRGCGWPPGPSPGCAWSCW